jgi:hypothetical protein
MKETAVLIAAIHQTPSLTRERYEEVVRRLTAGRSHVDSIEDLPFSGLLVHAAGQVGDSFVVFDVFESEDAVERFGEVVTPIAQAVGIKEPPVFFPAHTAVWR